MQETISSNDLVKEMPDFLEELIIDSIRELPFNNRWDIIIKLDLEEELEFIVEEINQRNQETGRREIIPDPRRLL